MLPNVEAVNETNFGMRDSDTVTVTLTAEGEHTELRRTIISICKWHHLACQPDDE